MTGFYYFSGWVCETIDLPVFGFQKILSTNTIPALKQSILFIKRRTNE